MRRVIVSMWVTLDGFVAGPTDEMDWLTVDDEMFDYEMGLVTRAGTLLLGRVTHGDFAGYWPQVAKDTSADENAQRYASRIDVMEKVVVSRTGHVADWKFTRILRDLDPGTMAALRREAGPDIVVYGSLSVVDALARLGMIDECHLLIHPLLLGSGKPLLPDGRRWDLALASVDAFRSGVILAKYQPPTADTVP